MKILAFILMLVVAVSSSAMAQMQTYRNIKNWTVSFDPKSRACFASSNHHYNGTHLFVRLPEATDSWQVGLFNKTWKVRESGRYPIKVSVDRISLLAGKAIGISNTAIMFNLKKGAKHTERFRYEFQEGRQMVIQGTGQRKWTAKLGLYGTRAAVNTIIDCVNYHKRTINSAPRVSQTPRAAPTRQQARSNFAYIDRERGLTLVANQMSRMGITGYRILPRSNPKSTMVEFVLADGTKGWFLVALRSANTVSRSKRGINVSGMGTLSTGFLNARNTGMSGSLLRLADRAKDHPSIYSKEKIDESQHTDPHRAW